MNLRVQNESWVLQKKNKYTRTALCTGSAIINQGSDMLSCFSSLVLRFNFYADLLEADCYSSVTAMSWSIWWFQATAWIFSWISSSVGFWDKESSSSSSIHLYTYPEVTPLLFRSFLSMRSCTTWSFITTGISRFSPSVLFSEWGIHSSSLHSSPWLTKARNAPLRGALQTFNS